MKGFLVSRGWQLERTHDLAKLTELAAGHDSRFSAHMEMAEELTDLFWDQHYPGGELANFAPDYDRMRTQAGEPIALIQACVPPTPPAA